MAELEQTLGGNNPLNQLLGNEAAITPGDAPSYQLCKVIYTYHPLGLKMADKPVRMAQSQRREITIPDSPEERCRERFEDVWDELDCDRHIFAAKSLSRVYGVSTLVLQVKGQATDTAVDYQKLSGLDIDFSTWDPLNTAGSLVLNQDPNAMDYQKPAGISVQGSNYHRSRTVVTMNENPIYIEYTSSGFGYVGRSVYQRAMFPLSSFLKTMITDDMVATKAGLLIAKLKQPGSAINNLMQKVAGIKRNYLKVGKTGNVLSISSEDNEDVTSINLQMLEGPATMARKNILENVAAADDMPAILLNDETFAQGFADGTEDAKSVAQYIDRIRGEMKALYDFMDKVVMYRAWSEDFYKVIQAEYPDSYGDVPYATAFTQWKNSFRAKWPSLLTEPDSEKVKVDDVKLKGLVTMVEAMKDALDPVNKAALFEWLADNVNDMKFMFTNPLLLDYDAMASYEPPQPTMGQQGGEEEDGQQQAPQPTGGEMGARSDSERQPRKALIEFQAAVARLQAPAAARLRGRQVARIIRMMGDDGPRSAQVEALIDHAIRTAGK